MGQKKIFLVFVAISTVSLLLLHGGHLSWNMEAFNIGCPAIPSHPSPGLKPKHKNVVFLKTHKTASSTMQNILFRFAERNNLTVALPLQNCGHQFCYPLLFTSHFVHPQTLPANIVTNHMRFNKAEMQRLMPNGTIYITILREPGSMFESLFSYYNQVCQSFRRVPNGSLEAFLEEPRRYYRRDDKFSMYGHNAATYDLGGDKDRPDTDTAYAQSFVAEVDKVFSLVMIAEYFDESLILLRHLLSWDLEDILYIKLNMRMSSSKKSLTSALSSKIRAWNVIDTRLYDHFNATLWRKISALGPACVAREVKLLRQAQERLVKSCFGGRTPPLRSAAKIKDKELRPWIPSGKVDIVGYELPVNLSMGFTRQVHELCLKLIMPELQYTEVLLRSQLLHYRRSHQLRPAQQSHPPPQPKRKSLPWHPQVQSGQLPPAAPGSATVTRSTSTSNPAAGTQGRTTKSGNESTQTQASLTPN
ncbi:galactose-3-O-sulfotransferase 3 [Anoplopoma fimbria]|uniref:galactose-3-O-sulfotransferase 3 n=1 Tax=Anoplopoma fimbria TaxID=229290 RepID=UPI0023EBC0FE|nr:galactose-3-O-sulfotransferase 3 [Anoplopoma fimbria]